MVSLHDDVTTMQSDDRAHACMIILLVDRPSVWHVCASVGRHTVLTHGMFEPIVTLRGQTDRREEAS